MESAPTLMLVDAHSLLYRAYHALPPLTTREGMATHAVYGFLRMLFRLLEEENPSHVAVAFDRPEETFREGTFQAYKAHRPPAPEDFPPQVEAAKAFLEALNIPCYEVPGYEADDVLGTLAEQARAQGYRVLLVSGDMDLLQLVGEGKEVLLTRKGISEVERYDSARVEERLGLRPEQIPDWKGLQGDSSDNIPGVPGIGEATARRLLQQFGDLETLLARREEVAPAKLRSALATYGQQARLSRELARIRTDVPIAFQPEATRRRPPQSKRLLELLQRYEFTSLLRQWQGWLASVEERGREYRFLRSKEEEQALLPRLAQQPLAYIVPVANEGVAIGWEGGEVFFLPRHREAPPQGSLFGEEEVPWEGDARLEEFLLSGPHWSGYHLQEVLLLAAPPGSGRPIPSPPLEGDVLLAAYLCDPGRSQYPLEELLMAHGFSLPTAAPPSWPGSLRAFQACAAVEALPALERALRERMASEALEAIYREMELPLVPLLARMTQAGIALDTVFLREVGKELEERIGEVERRIAELVGEAINLDSPRQLATLLYEKLNLPRGKRTKTGYSTDAATLAKLADKHPVVPLILQRRELAKLLSTYVEPLLAKVHPRTGRLHTTFLQTGTATGRLASSDPNLQNIPARSEWGMKIRRAFVAQGTQWCLLSADYSQIELRLLAHITGDETLCSGFQRGEDIHTRTACELFGVRPQEVTPDQRRMAKVVNFGLIYGMNEYGLAQRLEISPEEAKGYIERYFARFPGVRAYMEEAVETARRRGYTETLFGRRRYLPALQSPNPREQEAAGRAAINTPVQGSAADLIKIAMLRVAKALEEGGWRASLLLQIHDELLFEVHKEELRKVGRIVKEAMASVCRLRVPLEVHLSWGMNWRDMEPLEVEEGGKGEGRENP